MSSRASPFIGRLYSDPWVRPHGLRFSDPWVRPHVLHFIVVVNELNLKQPHASEPAGFTEFHTRPARGGGSPEGKNEHNADFVACAQGRSSSVLTLAAGKRWAEAALAAL
jgi:hypothetical protein